MTRNVRIVLTVWIVVGWIAVVAPQYANYHAQVQLQTVTAQQLVANPPGAGWYQVNGGYLDYPHTVGHEVNQADERGMARYTYESYVPYFDAASGKIVLLVLFRGADSAPSYMKAIDAEAQQANVNGTIDLAQKPDPTLVAELRKEQLPVDQNTPVLLMFGAPAKDRTSVVIAVSFVVAFILLLMVNVIRWEPRAPWDDFGERS